MRVRGALFGLLLCGTMMLASVPARADIFSDNRLSAYTITFSQPDFGDANAYYQVTNDMVSTAPPETVPFNVSLKTMHNSLMESGTGGISIGPFVDNGGNVLFNMTSDGSPGSWIQSYNTPVLPFFTPGTGFGNTWIINQNIGGLAGLEFGGGNGGGSGLVSNGFPFAVDVLINGDWSSQGTGAGQHQLVNLNPTWTIDNNFSYDAMTNMTDFHAHVDSYAGPGVGDPALDFILHSASPFLTPEPGGLTMALGLGGLVGLFSLGRRRR